jgi:hypothetical protein
VSTARLPAARTAAFPLLDHFSLFTLFFAFILGQFLSRSRQPCPPAFAPLAFRQPSGFVPSVAVTFIFTRYYSTTLCVAAADLEGK